MTAEHQRRREWPGLACDIAYIADPDSRLLKELAGDRRLEIFADLDEPGERRIAARRILWLPSKWEPAVMLGEHDHDRVDARKMLRGARRATPRPAAPDDIGRMTAGGAEAVPP